MYIYNEKYLKEYLGFLRKSDRLEHFMNLLNVFTFFLKTWVCWSTSDDGFVSWSSKYFGYQVSYFCKWFFLVAFLMLCMLLCGRWLWIWSTTWIRFNDSCQITCEKGKTLKFNKYVLDFRRLLLGDY